MCNYIYRCDFLLCVYICIGQLFFYLLSKYIMYINVCIIYCLYLKILLERIVDFLCVFYVHSKIRKSKNWTFEASKVSLLSRITLQPYFAPIHMSIKNWPTYGGKNG